MMHSASTSPVALLMLFCVPAGLSAAHPGLAKLVFSALFPVGLMVTILHGVELNTGAAQSWLLPTAATATATASTTGVGPASHTWQSALSDVGDRHL
jgi:formate/nitrite transporter FocA (FNT family)